MNNNWNGNKTVFKSYAEGNAKKGILSTAAIVKNEKKFEDVSQCNSFGGYLNPGFIDISFDSKELSDSFWNMAESNNWDCLILENPENGHIHSYFKDTKGIIRSGADIKLAVGLVADIKSGNTYIPLKVNGSERYPPSFEPKEIQEVPFELLPVKTDINLFGLHNLQGRNTTLFKYILVLQRQLHLSREEIISILKNTNEFVFADSLSESEFETITREEAFNQPVFFDGKTFLHDSCGEYIINNFNVARINNQLLIYHNGIYTDDINIINEKIRSVYPRIKKNQKAEVIDYMKDSSPEKIYSGDNYIAFNNGIINITTNEFMALSPEYYITNKIPWNYNPDAYNKDADNVLNRISCNDSDIRALLEECIGYCFYRKNILQKAFVLIGEKSNGKSTFIGVISHILGEDNISALDLKNLTDRFSKATLYKKLANIGDDISDDFITDPSLFKKIVSGDRIEAEYKGQPLFSFIPYVKLVFSANTMPRIKDKTGAVTRRLVIIPFNAKFSEDDKAYDPDIKTKLYKQSSMEYLILLGIKGLQRLLKNKSFTKSEKVSKELSDYEEYNNPVIAFFNDKEDGYLFREDTKTIYKSYCIWCNENGFQPDTKNQFGRTLKFLYRVESKQKTINGKPVRMYEKTK